MTTKDYIYLSLLVLSAVVFYFNGFFAGVTRARKLFERGLNDEESLAPEIVEESENESPAIASFEMPIVRRGRSDVVTGEQTTIRAVFGKN